MDDRARSRPPSLHALLRTIADTAGILATAPTYDDGIREVIHRIGEALDWAFGAAWTVIAADDRLECRHVWQTDRLDVSAFAEVTRKTRFERGVGLPGRVWATGRRAWIRDVTEDPNFPRRHAAARSGLRGAFAFPIMAGDRCLGVIEFLTTTIQSPDDELLRMMEGVGNQLGQFVERTRVEAAAVTSEASHAAIVASALDCIVVMDHEGRIVEFNPAAERTFGYARAEVVGRLMGEALVPPALRERHYAGLARYLATGEHRLLGQRIETTALHADGHMFPVELTIIRLPSPGPAMFAGFLRDISQRRRTDAERDELLAREQQARRLAEEAEQRASFLAEAGVLLSGSLEYETTFSNIVSLAVPAIADWCAAHIVQDDGSIRCVALAHRDPAITEVVWPYVKAYRFDPDAPEGGPRVIRTGQAVLYSEVPPDILRRMARDDEDLRVRELLGLESVVAVPLISRGQVFGALAFVMSHSGRRYTEKDLAFAEDLARRAGLAIDNARLYGDANAANRMKDDFLATLSHELRTPLNAILGWCRMLIAGSLSEGQRQHALAVIERNAVSQTAIVNDLLDVSRIITGRLVLNRRSVDLGAIFAAAVDTVRPSAEAKAIVIGVAIDAAVRSTSLVVDPDRLQQVLWNLLSNAVKFTPRGGRVGLRASVAGDDLEIEVTDTGEGIDAEILPYVFDRFRQADSSSRRAHGGLGLGLAIVRHLVELHGGTVAAASAGRGQGATFLVRLPMSTPAPAAAARPERAAMPRDGDLSGLDVLVVDDEDDARELFTLILETAGARVRTASSAAEALALVTASPPRLMLIDLGLPGADGIDLLRRIRALPDRAAANVSAIAVSAYAGEQHREAAREAGFQTYLPKPVDPAQLVQLSARVVAGDAPAEGAGRD